MRYMFCIFTFKIQKQSNYAHSITDLANCPKIILMKHDRMHKFVSEMSRNISQRNVKYCRIILIICGGGWVNFRGLLRLDGFWGCDFVCLYICKKDNSGMPLVVKDVNWGKRDDHEVYKN
jgi:hypothetical protein